MKLAFGRLAWTPATFWVSTRQELWCALEGWVEFHAPRRGTVPLNDDEIETLEDMKRRFPD